MGPQELAALSHLRKPVWSLDSSLNRPLPLATSEVLVSLLIQSGKLPMDQERVLKDNLLPGKIKEISSHLGNTKASV